MKNFEDYALIQKMQNSSIIDKEVVFNFFLPIAKLSGNSKTYKNFIKNGNKRIVELGPYGTIEIRNRLLTEIHRKVVSAIIQFGEIRKTQDGRIASFFKESDILRELEMGEKNHAKLREHIKTITDASYYITVEGFQYNLRIIDTHLSVDKNSKRMQGVIFNSEYVKMHRDDFSVNYKNLFNKIKAIPYATIPSIVNFLIIENKTKIKKEYPLNHILEKIGFPMESPQSLKIIKQHLKNYADKLLEDFCIEYKVPQKTLGYSKIDSITFIAPLDHENDLKQFYKKELYYKNENFIIEEIIQKDERSWVVKTNIRELNFNSFFDDFKFFLEQGTGEDSKLSLFSM